jgi:PHD/YefM family antitoxin component YafN of YafNO toxin-antitoxin module
MSSRKRKQTRKQWSVAEARAHLPELFEAAAREPQQVFRRREAAAVVVSPGEFKNWMMLARREQRQPSIEDAFALLRAEEASEFETPERRDRENAFAVDLG